jgi:hypothetical protein
MTITPDFRALWRGQPGDHLLTAALDKLADQEPGLRREFAAQFGLDPDDPETREHPTYQGRCMRRLMKILGPEHKHIVSHRMWDRVRHAS